MAQKEKTHKAEKKVAKAAEKEKKKAGAKILKGKEKATVGKTEAAKGKEKKKAVEKIEMPKVELKPEERLRNYEIILFPLITEKAVGMIESQNKISFVVRSNAKKADVRKAIEGTFAVKVDSVKIINDRKGRKKAIVKINESFKADEIATKLGVI